MKLAEYCDSSASYIGTIEIGIRFPSVEMIEKIASALQIEPHLLFQAGGMEKEPEEPEFTIPDDVKEEMIEQINSAVRKIIKRY